MYHCQSHFAPGATVTGKGGGGGTAVQQLMGVEPVFRKKTDD